jgi:hypothetical protein
MNTQLLCLFTTKEELDKSVDFILTNYTLTNPNVFILEKNNQIQYTLLTHLMKWLNQRQVDIWIILI